MARRYVLSLFVVLVVAASAILLNRTLAPPTHQEDLTRVVMSPYCPGLTLDACPSSSAVELRQEINQRQKDGESPAAIVADLEERFGDKVRGTPKAVGSGLFMWIAPGVAGGLILLLVALFTRRAVQRHARVDLAPAGPADSRLVDQLTDELRDLD